MEFVIPFEKRDILLRSSNHIRTLFDVQVDVQSEAASGKQWIKIHGREGGKALQKARDYIEALCCPEITKTIPNAARLISNLCFIAKNYGVVAIADNDNIILRGNEINVALAKSWIEKEYEGLSTGANGTPLSTMDTCRKFALKLCYSEEDINVVAKTLGPGPVDINTFLQELIRRKSSTASTQTKTVTEQRRRTDIVPRGVVARGIPTSDRTVRNVVEIPRQRFEEAQADGERYDDMCPIIIDGSNVAMHHGNHKVFSCRGIVLCIEWFKRRGHTEVFALIPRYRIGQPRPGYPIEDQQLLLELYRQGVVVLTPSRRVDDRRDIVCYDDRFILDLAHKRGGVVVSNDEYRDLKEENSAWKHIIEKRVLMFSFARDIFMVPDDPLGRKGPTLTEFLKRGAKIPHPRVCPWIGNCTYGSKCQYYHPEREQDSTTVEKSVQAGHGHQNQQHQHLQHVRQEQHLSEYYPQQHRSHEQYYQQHQQPAQFRNPHQYTDYEQQMASNWTSTYSVPFYSYTPPSSFAYNNSASYQETPVFTQLVDIFGTDKRENITRLLKENPQIENINTLIDKLLLEGN